MPIKSTQGVKNNKKQYVQQYGCFVLEVEDWIDGINNPAWQRKQIYGPSDEPYFLEASYKFSKL